VTAHRPNFLFIMADQLSAAALPSYGHPVVRTPHIDALAARSALFEQAYCNFPFCAPSRIAMLSGQLPSRVGGYDNGAEISSTVPTIMHYLRARGYHTSLSGKMHFIGPDQLHGYDERLTTDIYPADFATTPDWSVRKGPPVSGISFRGVVEAGVCARNLQIDFDEDVHHEAMRKLYALGRGKQERPFMLTVSYTHPHNPFNTTQHYWDRYDHAAIDLPAVPAIPYEARDPHSKRHYFLTRMDEYDMNEARIRNARHAYYGMIGYFDDKVGELLRALDDTGLSERTVVVLTADHGEMLGERGMWYKMCLFERAMRVPLMIRMPQATGGRRIAQPVSHLDVLPTMLDLADNGEPWSPVEPIDGDSLVPMMHGNGEVRSCDVHAEYTAEGAIAPCVMIRSGDHKYIWSEPDGAQLFDLARDPHEVQNLAGRADARDVEADMKRKIAARWDIPALEQEILKSQRRRRFLQPLLTFANGRSWDHEPMQDASQAYVRGGKSATNAKAQSRIPYVDPVPPDHPRPSMPND
jgi:choline-sulfatase